MSHKPGFEIEITIPLARFIDNDRGAIFKAFSDAGFPEHIIQEQIEAAGKAHNPVIGLRMTGEEFSRFLIARHRYGGKNLFGELHPAIISEHVEGHSVNDGHLHPAPKATTSLEMKLRAIGAYAHRTAERLCTVEGLRAALKVIDDGVHNLRVTLPAEACFPDESNFVTAPTTAVMFAEEYTRALCGVSERAIATAALAYELDLVETEVREIADKSKHGHFGPAIQGPLNRLAERLHHRRGELQTGGSLSVEAPGVLLVKRSVLLQAGIDAATSVVRSHDHHGSVPGVLVEKLRLWVERAERLIRWEK